MTSPRAARGDLAIRVAPGRDPGERALLAELALEAVRDGSTPAGGAIRLAERAFAWAGPVEWRTVGGAALALGRCDAGARAEGALASLAGTPGWAAVAPVRAELALRRGDLATAVSLEGAPVVRAWALLGQGRTEDAEALVAAGLGAADGGIDPRGGTDGAAWALAAAAVAAARGTAEDALAHALAAGAGPANPAAHPWRSIAAGPALRLGDRERARRLAGAELLLARRFGAPRALGTALRAAGLADGDTALLEESVAVLRPAATPVELGWSLAELGSHVRRTGERREARESLREALDLAEHAGARALAVYAREELSATGAKPRRDQTSGAGSLTPSEQRVAVLAAAGRSNREIAAELFVTMRTVTTHLTHVYAKLGIVGRDGIAAALGAHPDPDTAGGSPPPAAGGDDRSGTPVVVAPPAVAADPRATVDPATAAAAALARLDPAAQALAAAVAVLGTATAVDATALAELDPAAADRAWTVLTEAGVLRTAAGRLVLRDDAVAAAARATLSPVAASRAHGAAAALLGARGDVRGAAVHLLDATPAGDPAAVATLRRAAGAALEAGDPALAARLLRRALLEPPEPDQRAAVLFAAGDAGRRTRDARAVGLLQEALGALATDAPAGGLGRSGVSAVADGASTTAAAGPGRAAVAAALADALWHAGAVDEAWAVADAAVAGLGGEADPELLAPLESARGCAVLLGHAGHEAFEQRIDRLRSLAIAAGEQTSGLAAVESFWRWARSGDGAVRAFGAAHPVPATTAVDHDAACFLVLAERVGRDDVHGAEQLLTAVAEDAARSGAVAASLHALVWGSRLALRCGRAAAALADAEAAAALVARHDLATFAPLVAATLADALLVRGAVAAAAEALDAAAPDGRTPPAVAAFAASSRGRVLIAQGRRGEAVAVLRAGLDAARGLFADDPGVLPLRSQLALALAPEDPGTARRLVDEELATARARRRPRAIGAALHARAQLEEEDVAARTLAEAATTLRLAPAPLALAAVLIELREAAGVEEAFGLALAGGATAAAEAALDGLLDAGPA